jgi:hypothetical protein
MGRDILYKSELTEEIRNNATELLDKVNRLLAALNWGDVRVSSGWRPSVINAATPGAAVKSYHMIGKAVDILDIDHKLYDAILEQPELLEQLGLWMEDKSATATWTHLDFGVRAARTPRVFKP